MTKYGSKKLLQPLPGERNILQDLHVLYFLIYFRFVNFVSRIKKLRIILREIYFYLSFSDVVSFQIDKIRVRVVNGAERMDCCLEGDGVGWKRWRSIEIKLGSE